jgi:hypothetical protein
VVIVVAGSTRVPLLCAASGPAANIEHSVSSFMKVSLRIAAVDGFT